jgi:hypothetical protein
MAKGKTPQTISVKDTKKGTTKHLELAHATNLLKQLANTKLAGLFELPEGYSFDGNDIVKV